MTTGLFQLAYISTAAHPMPLADLETLLAGARRNNAAQGITGMLLYAEGAFLQVLEGKEPQVRDLYDRIRQDRRHFQPVIVHEGPLGQRHFPDWRMGFRQLDPAQLPLTAGYADLLEEHSSLRQAMAARPTLAYRLLLAFSHCSAMLPDLQELTEGLEGAD